VSCTNGCLDSPNCNDLAMCLNGCPKCVLQSGGNDLAGGGGTDGGGGGGGDMTAIDPLVASCDTLCEKIAMCNGGTAQTCEMQLLNCPNLSMANCTNAAAVSACWNGCAQGTCNALITCSMACPRCM
jgi:hypothetical protein